MITIIARHNESGKEYKFSKADWWNYSQTGLYTYVRTEISENEPEARSIEPKTVTVTTKSGCGCGKKKK